MTEPTSIARSPRVYPSTALRRLLTAMTHTARTAWIESLTDRQKAALHERLWTDFLAGTDQLLPAGEWGTWLNLGGRGSGKTRVGSETTLGEMRAGRARRIMLIERTPEDARETMIEGESGILACSGKHERPHYEPAKKRITWPNGARARIVTAAQPEKARGANVDFIWAEEVGSWKAAETWDNAQLALRKGTNPRTIATTSYRPTALLKAIIRHPATRVTRSTTFHNLRNLSPAYYRNVVLPMLGTARGRRELMAEMLEEADGALWERECLERTRLLPPQTHPLLLRIVVAVDPAASHGPDADETGIVGAGKGNDRQGYLLADVSGRLSPEKWARRAIDLYRELEADVIVAERNNGGEMVRATIAAVDRTVPVKLVWASRGKVTRADPIAARYELNTMHHVGVFPELEDELCLWEPGETGRGEYSPNRLDALVWAFSELFPQGGVAPSDLYGASTHATSETA